jgi:peptide/nickel transport system substrate-binding protein
MAGSTRSVLSRLMALGVGMTLAFGACASVVGASKAVGGGVVTFAQEPGNPPTYILPLVSASNYSNANISDFSELLYRPLYWFGNAGEPELNPKLSLAQPPVFTDDNQLATVILKHWVWSNGQPITARDVIFWMNLVSAVTSPNAPTVGSTSEPGPSWGGAVPGGFPENLVSYAQTGTYTVVFHLNASYNPKWYLYNELSQITPMPQGAWDELSQGGPVGNYDVPAEARSILPNTSPKQYVPANLGTATTGAFGVAQFLNSQSETLSTYASNPLWKVVDGPFRLASFTSSGFVKLVPNDRYSGEPKPRISAFEELPFTSEASEFNALRSGSVTIGYLPIEDLSSKAELEAHEGYKFAVWKVLGFAEFFYNYTNPRAGSIFRQLYFRQALQSLVNQPEFIKDFTGGVYSINDGPVPNVPPGNPDVSPLVKAGQVYPYDPTKAIKLLRQHGWTVVPGGISYCSKPGTNADECGGSIAAGAKAQFVVHYLPGSAVLSDEVDAMQSTMKSKAGIDLSLVSEPVGVVASESYGCTPSSPCSGWDIDNYSTGVSWVYFPDYLPTGEELFETGAASNSGDYSSATDNANITATQTAGTSAAEKAAFYRYENYLAMNLPYLEVPNPPYQLTMYKADLGGLLPQGIYAELYPEEYFYTH